MINPLRSPFPPPRRRNDLGHSKRCTKRNDDGDQPKNDCRHCKKFGRNNPHPNIPESKCNWNKKIKSWRPEWVCHKMKVEYVARSKFSSSNGGYPSSSDKNDWWCVDLDEESIDDDDWTVVKRKNNRNATYYVHIKTNFARLPNFSAPLNPHVENTIPIHHQSQFRLKAEQRHNKALKKQLASSYKAGAPQDIFNQSIEKLKRSIPRVRFHRTPNVATFDTSNDAPLCSFDSKLALLVDRDGVFYMCI